MWKCPNPRCQETVNDELDTCWNCGTGRDGTPPENGREFADLAAEAREDAEGKRYAGPSRIFTVLFALVGLLTGLLLTPVPYNVGPDDCGFLYLNPSGAWIAETCQRNQGAMLMGGALGLVIGLALGYFADTLIAQNAARASRVEDVPPTARPHEDDVAELQSQRRGKTPGHYQGPRSTSRSRKR